MNLLIKLLNKKIRKKRFLRESTITQFNVFIFSQKFGFQLNLVVFALTTSLMALFRLLLRPANRILSRNIKMSANMEQKAEQELEKLKTGEKLFKPFVTTFVTLLMNCRKSLLRQVRRKACKGKDKLS